MPFPHVWRADFKYTTGSIKFGRSAPLYKTGPFLRYAVRLSAS